MLISLQQERRKMQKLKKEMETLLNEIKQQTKSKSIKIYSKMKLKRLAKLLQKMYANGKQEQVFSILVKLKEAKVAKLFEIFNDEMAISLLEQIDNPKNAKLDAIKQKLNKHKSKKKG